MSVEDLRVGKTISCKYPKHGNRNILKRHTGAVEKVGVGPNGIYATIRESAGTVRSLSVKKMIDLQT